MQKRRNKMIPTIDKEIIEKLNSGMSPAEISIEYGKEGKNITASYVRHIKMLLKADMLHLLEEEFDISEEDRIAMTATTSREYANRKCK
jgi:hypothetical protein